MKNSFSRAIHLRDYVAPAWWVDEVELDVTLVDDGTALVAAVMMLRRTSMTAPTVVSPLSAIDTSRSMVSTHQAGAL